MVYVCFLDDDCSIVRFPIYKEPYLTAEESDVGQAEPLDALFPIP